MKKLNVSSQLLVIFTAVLLIATIIFSVITISYVHSFARDEVFSRLNSYSMFLDKKMLDGDGINDAPNKLPDMNIAYYVYDNGKIMESELSKYISADEFSELQKRIESETTHFDGPNLMISGEVKTAKDNIYYVYRYDDNRFTYVFTNSEYTTGMVSSIALRSTIIFTLLLLIAIVFVYYWNNTFVRRIKKLQRYVLDLPKTKYEKEYHDIHEDEIGELAESIDTMRSEIQKNESIKQEMLQNLSHDFKTPISVIKSYAEAIQDGVESIESLNVIIEQTDLLYKKVEKLLQYNSLEYLTNDREMENISMKVLVEDVVNSFKLQTNLNIELDLEESTFVGYKENWIIVINNILDNAKRYAKSMIKIVLRENRLRIYNDGDHLDEKFVNKQFKPYEKGSKGEFGLGMSIVQKTVNFFGYNLEARNDEVGVSFIITK